MSSVIWCFTSLSPSYNGESVLPRFFSILMDLPVLLRRFKCWQEQFPYDKSTSLFNYNNENINHYYVYYNRRS